MAKESIRISRILVMVLNRDLIVYSLSRKSRIAVNWSCDMDQGHEDTMMGSHPGGRVTACSVGCSILEYLMEMMVTSRWETFTLGREGTVLASVRVPYDISPCPDELTIRYCFLGLKSLEWYPIGALVFFDCWSKAIGSILRTSDRPSRNIDRVISALNHLIQVMVCECCLEQRVVGLKENRVKTVSEN
ncbi:hypothetical protein YC2023_122019 [Brassica napus]